jgi:hypothetical protein
VKRQTYPQVFSSFFLPAVERTRLGKQIGSRARQLPRRSCRSRARQLPPAGSRRTGAAPPAAPPCSTRMASPQSRGALGSGPSRRRCPLVAGQRRPLIGGDGGTSSALLQRHFPREPRRSGMGSRRVRFVSFSPRVRLTVGSILQSKLYYCFILFVFVPLYV